MSNLNDMKNRQLAAMQNMNNAANQSGLQNVYSHNPFQNSILQGYETTRYQNPLIGHDISRMPMDQLESSIAMLTKEYERRTLDTPLVGPTRRELQNDETLARAWEEYQVLAKLKGK